MVSTTPPVMEGYPDHILARLERRDRRLRRSAPSHVNGIGFELVIEDAKLWKVGTLTVSFAGGDRDLHAKIAAVADRWSEHANIRFDYGYDASSGTYRALNPEQDIHIRVGFSEAGYWSLVGTDSTDPDLVSYGEISLNLSDFDRELPEHWEGTVLHEFGHALGFHHEHQSPAIEDCEFNWDFLYDYLGGSPNYWPKWKVDHNLRKLPGGGLTYSAHDKESIMHYSFPDWMFTSGDHSPCYTTRNDILSAADKTMAAQAYPRDTDAAAEVVANRRANLTELVGAERLVASQQQRFKRQLRFLAG